MSGWHVAGFKHVPSADTNTNPLEQMPGHTIQQKSCIIKLNWKVFPTHDKRTKTVLISFSYKSSQNIWKC